MSGGCRRITPDFDQAARFLYVLAGDKQHTFQTFADAKGQGGGRGLVKCFHGRLADHAKALARLNDRGAGVFVTVNQTDLKGRKRENITRVRAVFIDIDTPGEAPSLELPPHILVESSAGKWHAYWVVSDCSLEQFNQVQSALSLRFGSDPAVKDLPRVMRLPGFFHRKGQPFQTRIIDATPRPSYLLDEVVHGLGLSDLMREGPVAKLPKPAGEVSTAFAGFQAGTLVSEGSAGGGVFVDVGCHDDALKLTAALARYGLPEESIREIVHTERMRGRWSRYLDEGEIDRLVAGAVAKFTPHDNPQEPLPLPDMLPAVSSLTPDLLPDNLREWLVDIAERLNVPLDFPASAALTVASIAVGRRAFICPQRAGDWVVVPNLWGALVGRPGSKKSPTLGAVMGPVNRLIGEFKAEFEREFAKHESSLVGIECEISAVESKIKKLANADDEDSQIERERLRSCLEKLSQLKVAPKERRFKSNDTTIEALAVLLASNPCGILVERDELMGWFRGMDRQGREQDRSFYLECWNGNGGYFDCDRIGRGHLTVKHPCVSVIGGIQPDPLRRYVAHALQGEGDGLLQRFQLAVWPDLPPLQAVDRATNEAALNTAQAVFERLLNIDPGIIAAASGFSTPEVMSSPVFRFDDEAQERFSGWKLALDRRIRDAQMPEMIASHLDKYGSMVASLALIFHLCDESGLNLRVPLHQVERAIGWANVLETHARRIYADAIAPGISAAHAIVRRIIDGHLSVDSITCRSIQRRGWPNLKEVSDVQAGLELLVRQRWLVARAREPAPNGGRPTVDYVLSTNAWIEDVDGRIIPKMGFGSSAGAVQNENEEAAA